MRIQNTGIGAPYKPPRTQIYLVDTNCDGTRMFDLLFAYAEAKKQVTGIDYKVLFTPSLIWEINGRAVGKTTPIDPNSNNVHRHIRNRAHHNGVSRKFLMNIYQDHIIMVPPTKEERDLLGRLNMLARRHKRKLDEISGISPNEGDGLKCKMKKEINDTINGKGEDFADRSFVDWLKNNVDNLVDSNTDFIVITRDEPLTRKLLTVVRDADPKGADLTVDNVPSSHFERYQLRGFLQQVINEAEELAPQCEAMKVVLEKAKKLSRDYKLNNASYSSANESACHAAFNRQQQILKENPSKAELIRANMSNIDRSAVR